MRIQYTVCTAGKNEQLSLFLLQRGLLLTPVLRFRFLQCEGIILLEYSRYLFILRFSLSRICGFQFRFFGVYFNYLPSLLVNFAGYLGWGGWGWGGWIDFYTKRVVYNKDQEALACEDIKFWSIFFFFVKSVFILLRWRNRVVD